jgi:hypothetical protein
MDIDAVPERDGMPGLEDGRVVSRPGGIEDTGIAVPDEPA